MAQRLPTLKADPVRRPILLLIGALMTLVVILAVAAMLGSMVVAQVNQGMAAAVNQAGTLRMQSYRIATALADQRLSVDRRWLRARELTAEQTARLTNARLTDAIPAARSDPVRIAYHRVLEHWEQVMRPAVLAAGTEAGETDYLDQVDGFVDQIHHLVRTLEERAERRIDTLRVMQAIALLLTIAVVVLTMRLLRRRVVRPLDDLLRIADRVRGGDFSVRTGWVGSDELGRLGAAMNLMTRRLWSIYNELEERVADKTRDLARSNHALQLLYRSSRMLDGSAMSDATLREVLADIQRQLKLRAVTLCLRDRRHQSPTDLGPHGPLPCIGTDSAQQQQTRACPMLGCPDGPESEAPSAMTPAPSERLSPLADHGNARESRTPETGAAETPEATEEGPLPVSFPVADQGHRYGTLRVIPGGGRALEPWQIPLLEALANQLAAALNLQGRLREGRRLVLHEERSILARELHDSLAQSLSYLKIQAVRLEAALSGKAPAGSSGPHAIVSEMREGISSAYRQLRELLMTFRLKIGGEGLATALAETVDEFRLRADLEIAVDDRLAAGVLSPNEEVHVLQIVREALSNATRHARAGHVKVRLSSDAESGVVSVEVSDDGVGLGADSHRRGHYGLTIMRERAASLGGTIQIANDGSSGTAVRLRFRPRQGRRSARETQEQPAREQTARHPASELRQ